MDKVILSTHQMKALEEASCDGKVTLFTLMQRAGKAVAEAILERYSKQPVTILCGAGNNGGDGFVTAYCLKKKNWPVTVYCAVDTHDLQGDASRAVDMWRGDVLSFDEFELPEDGIIIDAVFGTGLSREVEGITHDVLLSLRESDCPVVAVDVPSGANADTGECQLCTPQAEVTVTFSYKKPAHLLLPAREACGEIIVADIELDTDALEELGPFIMENAPSLSWGEGEFDKSIAAHKYHHGHVVVLGARAMTGATSLAATAALRVGAGLVTIAAPADTAAIYHLQNPSLIVETMTEMVRLKDHIQDERRNAVVIGCGAGQDNAAVLKKIVFDAVNQRPQKFCVIDADALTVFADAPQLLMQAVNGYCVLTPHEGEFKKLFPDIKGSKIERAYAAAKRSGAIIVLKGADTVIAAPDGRMVISTNGSPWLATAGSGDVLAGMIAGLLARDMMDVFDTVCAAVWMHGRASELAGVGMISSDLPAHIPAVLREIIDDRESDSSEEDNSGDEEE